MSSRNIRWGELTGVSNDKGPYKLHEVETDGKKMDVQAIEIYGMQGNAVKGGQVLILVPDGDEGKAVGIFMPSPKDRVEQQKEGEVQLKNHATGNSIQHAENGDTIVKTKGVFRVNP